jgi:hypothetical protein
MQFIREIYQTQDTGWGEWKDKIGYGGQNTNTKKSYNNNRYWDIKAKPNYET